MSVTDRIDLAKERTNRVVDHVRAAILIHEANAIVVYSTTLTGQIPRSRAAHAFRQFQRSMYHVEIVRLCALWDKADRDGESVPTIVGLVDDDEVRAILVEEARTRWLSGRPEFDHPFGEEQAAKEIELFDGAVARAKEIEALPRLVSVRNVRNKHLAHSLTSTNFEKKGSVHPMRYGDERWLFEETLKVVDGLHRGINGAGFRWDDARQKARRSAGALWNGCTFNVKD